MRSGAAVPITLKFLGEGRRRRVYLSPSGRTVVKVPKCGFGVSDNLIERDRYRHNPEGRYAPCRFWPGTNMLVMEYVEPIQRLCDKPEWADYIDCGQVGTSRSGKVLAYDYGN